MNSNDPQPDNSPAQAYLDGLMEAVGAREQMQRTRSGVLPPPSTGDPIVDSQNTVQWSRTIMKQKRQELGQAQQEFARIKQQFRAHQSKFPPQMQALFDALITMERTVMQQWLEEQVQPPESRFGTPPRTASGPQQQPDRDAAAIVPTKLKIQV